MYELLIGSSKKPNLNDGQPAAVVATTPGRKTQRSPSRQ